jgi:hypothetical protein
MLSAMDTYYTNLKENIGIDPNYQPQEQDFELERVCRDIKANATPLNFKEYLQRSENFKKPTPIKLISRQVHQKSCQLQINKQAVKLTNDLSCYQ